MFDFFRDIALEARGLDYKNVELERAKRKKEQQKEKIIFPSNVKTIVYLFAVFYIISVAATFPLLVQSSNILILVKDIIQIILALSTIVMLMMKKKKTEIIAIVLIVVFIMIQYSTIAVTLI